MIDPQTYTASAAGQSEQRTAGYMPVVGEKKAADAAHFSKLVSQAQNAGASTSTANSDSNTAKAAGTSGHHGFMDFLVTLFDIINPLEHLPIISTIYEHVTGHHMNAVARIAGDTLYGGPIGTAVGVANVVAEKQTGKDIGDNVLAMLSGNKTKPAPDTMVAQNDTPAPAPQIVWNDAPAPSAAPSKTDALGTALASATPSEQNAQLSMLKSSLTQNFPPLAAKTSQGVSDAGKKLTDYSMSRVPSVQTAKDGLSRSAGSTASARTDSTPVLSAQDAPADQPQQVLPPGLIAQKMMEGLDKYAALKKPQMSPGYTAAF